jgi:hypothetical protein
MVCDGVVEQLADLLGQQIARLVALISLQFSAQLLRFPGLVAY